MDKSRIDKTGGTDGGVRAGYSRQQKNIINVCLITSFITTFMGSALNLSIPDMERFFGVGAAQVGWVVTVYMLTCAALAVPFGQAADMGQRKRILCAGMVLFGGACAGAAASQVMWLMLAARVVQGIGASMIFCTNLAILAAGFEEDERGRVLGLAACANYLGLSAGPVLGGLINNYLGWQWIFVFSAAVTGAALVKAVRRLPGGCEAGSGEGGQTGHDAGSKEAGIKDDKAGAACFIAATALFMYGLAAVESGWWNLAFTTAGVVLFVILARIEKGKDKPVLDIKLFRENKAYTCSNIAALISYGAAYGLTYMFSLYLRTVSGYSSGICGLILAANTATISLLSPLFGRLSDKRSPHLLSAAGLALSAAALGTAALTGFLAPAGQPMSLFVILPVLAVSGLGSAMFSAPNTNIVMSCAGRDSYSRASAVLSSMRSAGHTLTMAAVTLVVSLNLGDSGLQQAEAGAVTSTVNIVFLILTVSCIFGIFMAVKKKM